MSAYLSPEACRTKALDCLIQADTLDDPKLKTAMLQYADWWNRLSEYGAGAARALDPAGDTGTAAQIS